MVRKTLFLFSFVLPLFALTCGNIKIKYNGANLFFFKNDKTLFKKVTFNTPISTVKCSYNKYIIITTGDALFLSTTDGKLLEKKYFTQKQDFLYATNNTLFFRQKGYFLYYKISKNGQIITKQIITDTTKNPIFIWSNKGKNIIFYNNRYNKDGHIFPITVLFIDNESLYYLNNANGKIYKTTPYTYKAKVSKLPPHSLRNKDAFLFEFSKLNQNKQITLFYALSKPSLKHDVFLALLKGKAKNTSLKHFVKNLLEKEGLENYYIVLKQSQWIKIPSFGKFDENNLNILMRRLQNFQESFDYSLFVKAGKFVCYEKFGREPHPKRYSLSCSLDDKKLFRIEIDGKCHRTKQQKKVLKRYKGFLTFTTVVYRSMFEINNYICKIPKNSNKTISSLYMYLPIKKLKHLTYDWKYTNKHLLYDIDSKQTDFGKTLQDVFSGSQKCFNISQECSKNCKFKNDENGFFIFSSSDREKCKNNCTAARYDCDHGKMMKVKDDICQAKCVGYNKGNGGIFHSSDYEKCMNKCLEN